MGNREQEILDEVVSVLRDTVRPERILLFGSRATGHASPQADFDIAVDCDLPDLDARRRIIDAIESKAGLFKVDLVYWQEIEDDFREVVRSTAKVLYEKRR